jgi:hypothetical protein
MSENKVSQEKTMTLRELFDLLETNGINPGDVEQVRGFIDQVKKADPMLADHIQRSISYLVGDEEESAPEVEE